MVEQVTSYKSNTGKLFLTEENALRHDAMERLCEIIPEFQMVRNRIESNLNAIAQAVGPILAYQQRVPSEPPAVDKGDPRQCPYNHPTGSRCPACADWEGYSHVNPRALRVADG